MTAFMVKDVTDWQTSQNVKSSEHAVKALSATTITPFQKVLETTASHVQENVQTKSAGSETDSVVKKAAKTKKVSTSGSSGAVTTLKDIFVRASEKYNISYDFLVAVAKAESDFNTKCVSSAGAQGIMQLMPRESKELGVDDPFDAEQNIMASARLLKAHLKKFDGDYTLAAAAYNAGSGRVQQYGGVPPFTETQNYVKKIKKYMQEGVTVPNKKVTVSSTESCQGSGGATAANTAEKTTSETAVPASAASAAFDEGTAATAADLEKIKITVGMGDDAVTMTYGAYLRYLQVGATGVG